jgi:hypothetical protein
MAPYGVSVFRHRGLTFVAPVNELDRDEKYLNKARTGNLTGYHTKLMATNRQNIHRNIVREIRYLVLTVRDSDKDKEQFGKYLYSVANVKLLPRCDLDVEITGKASDETEKYWVFELSGMPTPLRTVIKKPYAEHFNFKLTKAEYIPNVLYWDDIQGDLAVYEDVGTSW